MASVRAVFAYGGRPRPGLPWLRAGRSALRRSRERPHGLVSVEVSRNLGGSVSLSGRQGVDETFGGVKGYT